MVTPLGKLLRIIRINSDETSAQMAKKLHISPSYLSSIENGNRKIPYDLLELVTTAYKLTENDVTRLKGAIISSSELLSIQTKHFKENQQQLLYGLYKNEISEEDAKKILEIIRK